MKNKTLVDIQAQMHRIELMMLNENFHPKKQKRYKRWCKLTDAITRNLLDYFQVDHLWEAAAVIGRNTPLPYEVRITQ